MACTGTYLGGCCGPAPVPMTISAIATQRGFVCADYVNPWQLYQYAEYGVNWDYTIDGQRYVGYVNVAGWFEDSGVGPFYQNGGGPYDPELDSQITTFTSLEYIGETDIVLKWWRPTGAETGCAGDLVAQGFYRVFGPLKTAHDIAMERVNTYNPTGPAVPGVAVSPGTFADAVTSSSKIPQTSRRHRVCESFGISSGFQLNYERVTASARRVIVTPDTLRKLRLKPYDKTFDNFTTLGPCSSLDLDTGLDIAAPTLEPGMAETGILLTKHLKTAGDPCSL